MNKNTSLLPSLWLVTVFLLAASFAMAEDLASQYLRNGECYLLIGEGSPALRGIHRLNNPEAGKFYNPAIKVVRPENLRETLGFNVDLNRVLYTFTLLNDTNWVDDPEPLYRQVLDGGVTADHSDYGYHSYIHYDHRSWGQKTDVYRTGPVGRNIHADRNTVWSGFKSAGPGTPVSKPSGYTLPKMSGAAKLDEFPGKSWYRIPNKSWYSNWKTAVADPTGDAWAGGPVNGFNTFYYVFGDYVMAKYHNYYLYTWNPDNAANDDPGYSSTIGKIVAQTKEEKIDRRVLAGCLDGCGGATGADSAEAAEKHSDIAFQPPIKSEPSRTYFYTRTKGKTDGVVKKNNVIYDPSASGDTNPLIGMPNSVDTFWLCVSLRNVKSDYVYCLGTSAIKQWFSEATGASTAGMEIIAVTVSNQWDQEGGIVYAYDKYKKKIYKFERKEKEGTPIKSFLNIDLATDILEKIGAVKNSELDDIKADGFGSLYFALSHPSKNTTGYGSYDPRKYFKPNDFIDIKDFAHDDKDKTTSFRILYRQEYGKVVFKRDYLSGKISEIGRKNYAVRYYNVSGKVSDAGWADIKTSSPGSNLNAKLASWSAQIAGNPYTSTWPENYFNSGSAEFTGYPSYSFADPGKCKLAVINVPTPPRVISLGNNKSYLDIIGPYTSYPEPNKNERHTNQWLETSDGTVPSSFNLNLDTVYFYMVENYPLDDGAQDPTAELLTSGNQKVFSDFDKDRRWGGFITSIKDPAPKSDLHPYGVVYEWKTWMVENLYKQPVCDLARVSNDSQPYNYLYSPVPGKFIMTCRVKYHWYNYNALLFGSTIDDLKDVLHLDEWALPVAPYSSAISAEAIGNLKFQSAADRLNEIMKLDEFKFMQNAKDADGNTIDYAKIFAGENGKFWAMEPMVVPGVGTYSPMVEYARIERCDDIPGVASSTYIYNNSYWSAAPATLNGSFGIESDQTYNWRIDIASQTNLFKDISKCNGTNPNAPDFNYVAYMLASPTSPIYVNKKANFKFLNRLGDLRWADNEITVSAKLQGYKVPAAGAPYYEEKSIPLQLNVSSGEYVSSSVGSGGNYMATYTVLPETFLWNINKPVFATTKNNLPPTDPMEAELVIEMSRWYKYDMWVYYKGEPSFPVYNLPGRITITGKAKVRIMDTQKPRIVWSETKPMNLFGETGQPLKKGVGPAGKANPANLSFTISDNTPWEGVDNQAGLPLSDHVKNIAYNFGYDYCKTYCNTNAELKKVFDVVGPSVAGYKGIREEILIRKGLGKKTSDLNYKPLFSRSARHVNLGFDAVMRKNPNNTDSPVALAKANTIFENEGYQINKERMFDTKYSAYSVHYFNGGKYENLLKLTNSSFFKMEGATTIYESSVKYSVPISDIRVGADFTKNKIPDFYANNTPGYRTYGGNGQVSIKPYKFYLSLTDSSGNFVGERELNVALHVKDTIPPVAYGSVYHKKDPGMTSFFPYINSLATTTDNLACAPAYKLEGGNYFTDSDTGRGLLPEVLYSLKWLPANDKDGYILHSGEKLGYINYQAMKSLGDDICKNIEKDAIYVSQIKNGLNPRPVEDNVECELKTFASDNSGLGLSTMTFRYNKAIGGQNGWQEMVDSVCATYTALTPSFYNSPVGPGGSLTSSKSNVVFRGDKKDFPMAIPITIEARDNALDWDFYIGGSADIGNGTWKWDSPVLGKDAPNTRKFKTSLPVFGTDLEIRTLDKTIKNKD